jgi:hypothetical protein
MNLKHTILALVGKANQGWLHVRMYRQLNSTKHSLCVQQVLIATLHKVLATSVFVKAWK